MEFEFSIWSLLIVIVLAFVIHAWGSKHRR